jgi:hypothetical protein
MTTDASSTIMSCAIAMTASDHQRRGSGSVPGEFVPPAVWTADCSLLIEIASSGGCVWVARLLFGAVTPFLVLYGTCVPFVKA